MIKVSKIAPIQKQYGNDVQHLEQQLSLHGLNRFPGTSEMIIPYKEKSGKYRTGLDVEAPYLLRLSDEDRAAEIKRITEDKVRLETALGVPGILNPTSIFYNFSASVEQLKAKWGTDLQVQPVKLGEKDVVFNHSDIMAEINWNWISVHPRIASSLDAFNSKKVDPNVKYVIVDDEAETKAEFSKNKTINRAIVDMEELTPTKKKQIARLMGIPVSDDAKEEVVYNLLSNQLRDIEIRGGKNKGMAPIRLFNELIKETDDRLKVKDLVMEALDHNIYRPGVGGKVLEGGKTIAISPEELIEDLLKEEHQIDLIALEKKVKNKKIEA